ncbi:MAG: GspH/FimT family protein [Steroidobacteraceae bacterium]
MPDLRRLALGLSWVELLAVLAVAAVLAALAAPSFARLRGEAASLAAANALMGGLHLARSQALLRSTPAVLCLSADGQRCLGDARSLQARGWLVFVDRSRRRAASGPPHLTPVTCSSIATPPPRRCAACMARAPAVTYWPVSRAGTTATFTVCARPALAPPRAIVVSQSGRPRLRQRTMAAGPCDG